MPEQKSGTSAINPMAPSRWNMNAFPINLKASAAFTASERQAIDDSALSWDASIAFGINFFDTTGTTSVTQYGSLGPYLDSEMGIYKSTSWPSAELPSNALAITQIFGYRKLTGTANEYVEIFHADIILNDMA